VDGLLPPPPEEPARVTSSGERLSNPQKFFAILGIVFGFLIFFTIPGWYGVRAWRRYKRGEESSIRMYEYMGIAFAALLIFAIVGGVVESTTESESASDAETSGESCFDALAVKQESKHVNQAFASATAAFKAGDLNAAATHLREAADAWRATAEAVAADAEVASLVTESASQLDAAADAADAGRYGAYSRAIRKYQDLYRQANTAFKESTVREC
jgi:hypothetical protein